MKEAASNYFRDGLFSFIHGANPCPIFFDCAYMLPLYYVAKYVKQVTVKPLDLLRSF